MNTYAKKGRGDALEAPSGAAEFSPGRKPWDPGGINIKPRRGDTISSELQMCRAASRCVGASRRLLPNVAAAGELPAYATACGSRYNTTLIIRYNTTLIDKGAAPEKPRKCCPAEARRYV